MAVRKKLSLPLVLVLVVFTAISALVLPQSGGAAPGSPGTGVGEPGYIRRFAANFSTFGTPPELVTNLPPAPGAEGGLIIYDKDFFTADDINVLYVTVSATGDAHGGARLQLACKLDNAPCNPGPNPVGGAPNGWVTLQRHDNYNENYAGPGFAGDGGGGAGDVHDNAINYTWCTPIKGAGVHNVEVRMASSPASGDPGSAGQPVFMEAVHYFIDGSRVADPSGACVPVQVSAAAEPGGPTVESERLKHGHPHR